MEFEYVQVKHKNSRPINEENTWKIKRNEMNIHHVPQKK